MTKWKLVEYKKVSEEEPTEDINKLSHLRDALNEKVNKNEGLIYMVEPVEE